MFEKIWAWWILKRNHYCIKHKIPMRYDGAHRGSLIVLRYGEWIEIFLILIFGCNLFSQKVTGPYDPKTETDFYQFVFHRITDAVALDSFFSDTSNFTIKTMLEGDTLTTLFWQPNWRVEYDDSLNYSNVLLHDSVFSKTFFNDPLFYPKYIDPPQYIKDRIDSTIIDSTTITTIIIEMVLNFRGCYEQYLFTSPIYGRISPRGAPIRLEILENPFLPPVISDGSPTGIIPATTTDTIMSIRTNVSAIAKFDTLPGISFDNMQNTFSNTGGTFHSQLISGLEIGKTYTYYVKCKNDSGIINDNDYIINFSVADTSKLEITNLIVQSGAPYKIVYGGFLNGDSVYIDRNYVFAQISDSLDSLTYIMTANDDKSEIGDNFLSFDVNINVTVYIGYDDRISTQPSWLSSWENSNSDVLIDGNTHSLYKKDFNAGNIIIGGNSGGSKSMYTVVIKGGEKIITPPEILGVPQNLKITK